VRTRALRDREKENSARPRGSKKKRAGTQEDACRGIGFWAGDSKGEKKGRNAKGRGQPRFFRGLRKVGKRKGRGRGGGGEHQGFCR